LEKQLVFTQLNNKSRLIFIIFSVCIVLTAGGIYKAYLSPVKSVSSDHSIFGAEPTYATVDTSLDATNAIDRINGARKNVGLTVLTENALLDTAALKGAENLATNPTGSHQILDKVKTSGYYYESLSTYYLTGCTDLTCVDQLFTGNDKNEALSSQWNDIGIGIYTPQTNPTQTHGTKVISQPGNSIQGGITIDTTNNTNTPAPTTYLVIVWGQAGTKNNTTQGQSSTTSTTPSYNSTYTGSTVDCPSGDCPPTTTTFDSPNVDLHPTQTTMDNSKYYAPARPCSPPYYMHYSGCGY
jgi:hypothetical protein